MVTTLTWLQRQVENCEMVDDGKYWCFLLRLTGIRVLPFAVFPPSLQVIFIFVPVSICEMVKEILCYQLCYPLSSHIWHCSCVCISSPRPGLVWQPSIRVYIFVVQHGHFNLVLAIYCVRLGHPPCKFCLPCMWSSAFSLSHSTLTKVSTLCICFSPSAFFRFCLLCSHMMCSRLPLNKLHRRNCPRNNFCNPHSSNDCPKCFNLTAWSVLLCLGMCRCGQRLWQSSS